MLRPKLNRIWASTSSNTRRDPGDTKYIQGWISEIPTYQVLNYLQYKIDTTLLALAERGIAEWGSDVQYGLNSLVWNELDKTVYVSTVGSPDKTKAPSENLSQWTKSSIQIPRADYDTVVAAINAHIADVTGNPHKLTAGRLDAYNKAEIDAIVVTYRNLVSAHAADKNNPHGVTALQVGAVPSTGGTYTGDVIFNGGLYFDSGKVNQISKLNGLFLQQGSFVLGINSSGVAVAGTTTTKTPIVTEQTFPALKAALEPAYAVPKPSFEMNLIKTINIKSGTGTVDTGAWTPAFDSATGALLVTSDGGRQLIASDVTVPTNSPGFTIAFDFYVSQDAGASGGIDAVVTLAFAAVSIGNNNQVNANGTGGTGASAKVALTRKWTRIVATFKGTNVRLYADGVLIASSTSVVIGTTQDGKFRIQSQDRGSNARYCYFKNVRIWQSDELTAPQVSTL